MPCFSTCMCRERRYGDSLRAGWRNIMECVVRLYQLGLLPPAVLLMEAEDPAAAAQRLPKPSTARRSSTATSLISRAFSRSLALLLCWACTAIPTYMRSEHPGLGQCLYAAGTFTSAGPTFFTEHSDIWRQRADIELAGSLHLSSHHRRPIKPSWLLRTSAALQLKAKANHTPWALSD